MNKKEYKIVVFGCLKTVETEKEVCEEFANYLASSAGKRGVMTFSVFYSEGEADGRIAGSLIAVCREIKIIAGGENMASLVLKMRKTGCGLSL